MTAADYAAVPPEDVSRALREHTRWIVERDRVYRDIRLPSFRAAIACVDAVAEVAERLGHHPNIVVHEWCYVRFELYSHAAGHLSQRDIELALAIDDAIGTGEGDGDA